ISDPRTDLLRGAIEHRATWFSLMIDEAVKAGADKDFAGRAVFNCGRFHGENKYPKTNDIKVFAEAFANDDVVKCFEMDVKCDDTKLDIDFHYCPLVEAWKKLGVPEADMPKLCDMAMDGDRGIISTYDSFEFNLGKTIAKGDDICEIRIKKVK
ncbi:MAG: L-2-amino-thiazoline-4-carboxylic acid hydrolase, partial [Pygmaiobacter sp.]